MAGGFFEFNMGNHLVKMTNTAGSVHTKLRRLCDLRTEDTFKIQGLGHVPKWKILAGQKQTKENQNDKWEGILNEDAFSVSGDRKMARLEFVLSNIPKMIRHEYQVMFHREMEMAMLPKIYDSEWDSDSNTILMKYKQLTHKPEKLIVCPRRFGKTASIVMFIVAVLYVIPGITIAVFSTCKRTAAKLITWATRLLQQMPGFQEKKAKVNSEEIVLQFSQGDQRTVNCYPGLVAVCIFI